MLDPVPRPDKFSQNNEVSVDASGCATDAVQLRVTRTRRGREKPTLSRGRRERGDTAKPTGPGFGSGPNTSRTGGHRAILTPFCTPHLWCWVAPVLLSVDWARFSHERSPGLTSLFVSLQMPDAAGPALPVTKPVKNHTHMHAHAHGPHFNKHFSR